MEQENTKINKYERYKLRLSPYDFFPQIATLDFDNLGDADRYYLQDFGIFNADFLEDAFTLRVRIAAGRLTPQEFSALAQIVSAYDLHIILTARAGLQLHGLDAKNILDVFYKVNALGLTTWQSFGDNVRNIVCDVYDGVGEFCEIEVYPILMQMQERVLKNPRYVGMLPRRISVGISGNRANVLSLFANDLYFALAQKENIFGFNVYMGGKNSEMAQNADIFLQTSEVSDFFVAFIEAFFLHGSRGSRLKTRLFYMLENIGIEKFKAYIQNEYKKPFQNAGQTILEKAKFNECQRLKDGSYAFCYQTDFARLNAAQMHCIAQYASEHDAAIRLGIDHNIYLLGLKEADTAFAPAHKNATILACAGSEYCPYSYWNIKDETSYLPLEKILKHRILVGFSGCAKGCARHQHSDIGLIGLRTNNFGNAEGGARVFLGAQHTKGKSVGRMIFSMVPLQHLHTLLNLIIAMYEESGYGDFEMYAQKVLNQYSEDFLALWFLLNLQTGQKIKLLARKNSSFEYEKSLFGVHFFGLEVLDFDDESFKKVISSLSKQLWTI
ncbi:MAG TPA: ferredoxin--nitrite reductase [Sulfurimonas sp. UBA12504]|nr:MAG: ferredoxin--nitrite reductase [Sulfurimonas sp. GWF2_37_8]DAB29832.1 MAG TPA: ferredoxin--nitrite reductase [Sulfurimonas sp. UBA12504]